MNNKVLNVEKLYDDSKALYDKVVVGEAEDSVSYIISNLKNGYDNLTGIWKGADAGTQINNLVNVYNDLVAIRNFLGYLASTSSGIACYYREIQISNKGGLDSLNKIINEDITTLPAYFDNTDTVDITPEANTGKKYIETARDCMSKFISSATTYKEEIFNNWSDGPGRIDLIGRFEKLISEATSYSVTLDEVAKSIAQAIQNYGIL